MIFFLEGKDLSINHLQNKSNAYKIILIKHLVNCKIPPIFAHNKRTSSEHPSKTSIFSCISDNYTQTKLSQN